MLIIIKQKLCLQNETSLKKKNEKSKSGLSTVQN